jgi:hypothetical protein
LPRFCRRKLAAITNAALPSTMLLRLFSLSLSLLSSLPFPSLLPPLLLVDYCFFFAPAIAVAADVFVATVAGSNQRSESLSLNID